VTGVQTCALPIFIIKYRRILFRAITGRRSNRSDIWYSIVGNNIRNDYREYCRNLRESIFSCSLVSSWTSRTCNGETYQLLFLLVMGYQYHFTDCRIDYRINIERNLWRASVFLSESNSPKAFYICFQRVWREKIV